MENTTRISSISQMKSTLDKNLELLLDIHECKYGLKPENLFKLAARKNLKREFLFVSRLIGKHLPINPNILSISGAILARLWLEKKEEVQSFDIEILVDVLNKLQSPEGANVFEIETAMKIVDTPLKLSHKTLFIGFAETATGIAHAVFNCFSKATLIHTSRENIKSIPPAIFFKEEHSHAVEQLLYPEDPNIFTYYEDIVLIDDELTTGKTALNLMRCLEGESFGIISILDWRDEESLKIFEEVEDIKIETCALLKGRVQCNRYGEINEEDLFISAEGREALKTINFQEVNLENSENIDGFLKFSGRFGMDSEKQIKLREYVKRAGNKLKLLRTVEKCLCIGTGEFIYIPCLISTHMGEKVYFQASTRSPIFARPISMGVEEKALEYGINSKIEFKNPLDVTLSNYLYNIPQNYYEQVFFFTEKALTEEKKKELSTIFLELGIKTQVFVNCT